MRKSRRPGRVSHTPPAPEVSPAPAEAPFERRELGPSGAVGGTRSEDGPLEGAERDMQDAPFEGEPQHEAYVGLPPDQAPPPQGWQEPPPAYEDAHAYEDQAQRHAYSEADVPPEEVPYPEAPAADYADAPPEGEAYPAPPDGERAHDDETAPMGADVSYPYEAAPMTGPPHLLQPDVYGAPMTGPPHLVAQQLQQLQAQAPNSGPYRVPPYDPTFRPARGVPIPRPVLGSALAVYGVLLWSFVVAGQFATSWISGAPMDQKLAAFLVVAATTIAFVAAVRRSRSALPPPNRTKLVARALAIGALAFAAFLATILTATFVGQAATSNHDFVIAFLLVAMGAVAAAIGPRLTHPLRPTATHGARFAVVLMWVAGAIATFVAGAELATIG